MLDPSDRAPLGHDGYFKRWSLSDPEIPGTFILMDEAQDTNPAMLAALKNQDAQVVYVGDRYQQIYEWRGAVNAMERVTTKHECSLTQSFRFGNAIADAASILLQSLGERQRLTGTPNIPSKLGCGQPNAILCRTNAAVIDYVIQAFAADITPHVLGGTQRR
jgi:superfamily I DNA/RNA helicase